MAKYIDPESRRQVCLKELACWHALRSDNPTVGTALQNLIVAVKLAHGEELAVDAKIKHLDSSPFHGAILEAMKEGERHARYEYRLREDARMRRNTRIMGVLALITCVASLVVMGTGL